MESRRTDIIITYEGKDISLDLKPHLKSFSYTDCASGAADTVAIGIADFDNKWIDAWFPEKTDKLSASIVTKNWLKDGDEQVLECGVFTVDNISFDGPPSSLALEAISTPAAESFNCRKNTKIWEKTTIKAIAAQIAADAGVGIEYDAPDIALDILEQSEETDMSFLSQLCEDYGLAMKTYSDKLIIFDEETYESKAAVTRLTIQDCISWSGNTTLTGTADRAAIKYSDPKSGEELTYVYIDPNAKGNREIEANEKADNLADAMKKAKAELRRANRGAVSMNLTTDAHCGLVAAQCIDISGFGKFDGKYFIDRVIHKLEGGYTIEIEVRRID